MKIPPTVKGMTNMKPTIQKYIDRCVIDEYANKDYLNGFHLDVTDMSKHDQNNFLDLLMNQDDVLRELVLDRMQELINERLNAVEQ